jgi:hypothetical protein
VRLRINIHIYIHTYIHVPTGNTLQKNESARLQNFMKNRSTYLDDEIQKMREKLKSDKIDSISTPQYKPRDFIGAIKKFHIHILLHQYIFMCMYMFTHIYAYFLVHSKFCILEYASIFV